MNRLKNFTIALFILPLLLVCMFVLLPPTFLILLFATLFTDRIRFFTVTIDRLGGKHYDLIKIK